MPRSPTTPRMMAASMQCCLYRLPAVSFPQFLSVRREVQLWLSVRGLLFWKVSDVLYAECNMELKKRNDARTRLQEMCTSKYNYSITHTPFNMQLIRGNLLCGRCALGLV